MTTEQREKLRHFVLRPTMWISDIHQDQVVAFVHGVQLGDDTIKLTETLSVNLEKRYEIKMMATGWPYQVERFAQKQKISWFDAFKHLVLEVLDEQ